MEITFVFLFPKRLKKHTKYFFDVFLKNRN